MSAIDYAGFKHDFRVLFGFEVPGRRLRRAGRNRRPDRGVDSDGERDAPVSPAPGRGSLPALRSCRDRDAQRGDRSPGRLLRFAPLPRPGAADRRAGTRAPVSARLSRVPVAREVAAALEAAPRPHPIPSPPLRGARGPDSSLLLGSPACPGAALSAGAALSLGAALSAGAAFSVGRGLVLGRGLRGRHRIAVGRWRASPSWPSPSPSAWRRRALARASLALRLRRPLPSRSGDGLMSSGSGWVWTFSSVAEQPELDATVLLLAFLGLVVGDRLVGSVADRADAGLVDAGGNQEQLHRLGALARQLHVEVALALVRGVARDLDPQRRVLLEHAHRFLEQRERRRLDVGRVAPEVDSLDDAGELLDRRRAPRRGSRHRPDSRSWSRPRSGTCPSRRGRRPCRCPDPGSRPRPRTCPCPRARRGTCPCRRRCRRRPCPPRGSRRARPGPALSGHLSLRSTTPSPSVSLSGQPSFSFGPACVGHLSCSSGMPSLSLSLISGGGGGGGAGSRAAEREADAGHELPVEREALRVRVRDADGARVQPEMDDVGEVISWRRRRRGIRSRCPS